MTWWALIAEVMALIRRLIDRLDRRRAIDEGTARARRDLEAVASDRIARARAARDDVERRVRGADPAADRGGDGGADPG